MTDLTTANLRERVAEHLTIMASDIPLDADDAARIDRSIVDVTTHERENGLVWWADNAIPAAAALPFTLMVAAVACAKVGKAGQGFEAGYETGAKGLGKIRPSSVIEDCALDYY